MKLSCTIVCTISCVSFSLCAMEQNEQDKLLITNSSKQIQINQDHYYPLNNLYKTTRQALENYKTTDNQSIKNIFHIITATENLLSKEFHTKEFGIFAYNQPIIRGRYISVFFERIIQHIAHMKKNNFTAPTAEQFIRHKDRLANDAAVAKATTFRVIITLNAIDPYNTLTADAPISITEGLKELERLIEDIKTIQQTNLEDIERMAKLIYNPQL
jgi:hypothetical protein